jgi:hypothetical protein
MILAALLPCRLFGMAALVLRRSSADLTKPLN